MNFKPKNIKHILLKLIKQQALERSMYVKNPGRDFTRNRKLTYEKMLLSLLAMEGTSLKNEMLKQFGYSKNAVTSSAFIQQRDKILPEAFEKLFKDFSDKTENISTFMGYRLLAADGSDVMVPTNKDDIGSYINAKDGRKAYNRVHLNALYDIKTLVYKDAIVSKPKISGEKTAFTDMIDRLNISGNVLIIADRGYEGYNTMAHIQERNWKYLIRVKDFSKYSKGIIDGLILPAQNEFDEYIDMNLTRSNRKEVRELAKDKNRYRKISNKHFDFLPKNLTKGKPIEMYHLPFRIVRFKITDDTYEVVVTNLDKEDFPPETLKQLYSMRWGIETSFRDLKYTIGLSCFHSKKAEYIIQEIFARLIMYNFSSLVTSHIIIEKKKRKYDYKINFSVAVHICRDFLFGKNIPPDIEALIARHITPIRPGRSRPRNVKAQQAVSFIYRLA